MGATDPTSISKPFAMCRPRFQSLPHNELQWSHREGIRAMVVFIVKSLIIYLSTQDKTISNVDNTRHCLEVLLEKGIHEFIA